MIESEGWAHFPCSACTSARRKAQRKEQGRAQSSCNSSAKDLTEREPRGCSHRVRNCSHPPKRGLAGAPRVTPELGFLQGEGQRDRELELHLLPALQHLLMEELPAHCGDIKGCGMAEVPPASLSDRASTVTGMWLPCMPGWPQGHQIPGIPNSCRFSKPRGHRDSKSVAHQGCSCSCGRGLDLGNALVG